MVVVGGGVVVLGLLVVLLRILWIQSLLLLFAVFVFDLLGLECLLESEMSLNPFLPAL